MTLKTTSKKKKRKTIADLDEQIQELLMSHLELMRAHNNLVLEVDKMFKSMKKEDKLIIRAEDL